jgi:hypothetical protein
VNKRPALHFLEALPSVPWEFGLTRRFLGPGPTPTPAHSPIYWDDYRPGVNTMGSVYFAKRRAFVARDRDGRRFLEMYPNSAARARRRTASRETPSPRFHRAGSSHAGALHFGHRSGSAPPSPRYVGVQIARWPVVPADIPITSETNAAQRHRCSISASHRAHSTYHAGRRTERGWVTAPQPRQAQARRSRPGTRGRRAPPPHRSGHGLPR